MPEIRRIRHAVRAPCALRRAFARPPFAQPKTTPDRRHRPQDIGSLDPHFAVSTIDRIPVAWMFNGLARFPPGSNDPAKLEPDLAQSWQSSVTG